MSKPGSENLIPINKRTKEEAREISAKGGKKSGESRRFKKTFREALMQRFKDADEDKKLELADMLLEEALTGPNRLKAFEIIRDTMGEKPTEKLEVDGKGKLKVSIKVVE